MKEICARDIALAAHGNQMYGSDQPYSVHLQSVVDVLKELGHGSNTELLCAAWLHDVLEDTTESPASLLESGVTPYVLALVDAVTNEPGKNRAERHAATYPRITRMPEAVTLKIADRIANIRASIESRPDLLKMYIREHKGFFNALTDNSAGMMNYREWTALQRLIVKAIKSGVVE